MNEMNYKQPAYNPGYFAPEQMQSDPAYQPIAPRPAVAPYYPGNPGMPFNPAYPQTASQTIITQQPTSITLTTVSVGPRSMVMGCPNCRNTIRTQTDSEIKCCGYLLCCFMLCSGVCTLCSCIPLCSDSCRIVHHKCPECKANLGTYQQ
ncbi:cell death-inducing p53-target protein 1-like [Diaphorina citri]|uniref:Cell death-inducing p53-target protein 1-like n=1 Tax=Diaphorina citri TaxID=121845 RepID=A0A1S3DRL2_DIACI|nr:cell death-inducing p53-target protein 1-like [Diaphorina citri]